MATDFSGSPAWRLLKCSLQPTSKPQLDGCSGARSTPRACSQGHQAPSEPRRGQLAPPSASTVALRRHGQRALRRIEAQGAGLVPAQPTVPHVQPHALPAQPVQPGAQQGRGLHVGGEHATRAADEGGDAQARRPGPHGLGAELAQQRRQHRPRAPHNALTKASKGSPCVRFSPPTPASRNLRPTDGMASKTSTRQPPAASVSAAISPAGPAPMTATTGLSRPRAAATR